MRDIAPKISRPIAPDRACCCRRADGNPEHGSAPAARLRHQEPCQCCPSEPSPGFCYPGWHCLCVSSGHLRGAGCPSHCARGERNFLHSFRKHGMRKRFLLVCLQSPCKRVLTLPVPCPPFCGGRDTAMQLAQHLAEGEMAVLWMYCTQPGCLWLSCILTCRCVHCWH